MLSSSWSARVGLSVLFTAAAGLLASPAHAASTGVARVILSGHIEYKAASGKQNRVVITRSGNTVTIDDVATISAGKGCKAVKGDKTRVRCSMVSSSTRAQVYTYDRDDSVENRGDIGLSASAGSGADRLTGGPRGDYLAGGSGNDRIWGNGGGDKLAGDSGNDALSAGDGHDYLMGGVGADRLYGGADGDYLVDGPGNDRSYGGAGTDELEQGTAYSEDRDVLSGGSGGDRVSYSGRTRALSIDADGATGDDGQAGERDSIGSDVEALAGGAASDRLGGNASDNTLVGLGGDDLLIGLGGNDQLVGDLGRDRIYGGDGNDDLYGDMTEKSAVADLLSGGAGIDQVYYLGYAKGVTVDLDGASGDDGVAGERDTVGADVEKIEGGAGNDRLTGNSADNYLNGGSGDDILIGGAGNDMLVDSVGRDSLYGGDGDDDLHEQGDTTGTVDLLNGGAHGSRGDGCWESPGDTLVGCEF